MSLSTICAYFFIKYGISVFSVLFWFKIITLILIFLYIKNYRHEEYYFYKNLGVGKKKLWTFSFVIDMVIYFIFTIIALNLYEKHS